MKNVFYLITLVLASGLASFGQRLWPAYARGTATDGIRLEVSECEFTGEGTEIALPDLQAAHAAVARERDGRWVLSLRVSSPGASGLQFLVEDLRLDAGSKLVLYEASAVGEPLIQSAFYQGAGPLGGEPFWTDAVLGSEAVLEVVLDRGRARNLPFRLTAVRHLSADGLDKLLQQTRTFEEPFRQDIEGTSGTAMFRGVEVPYVVRNGLAIFEGDIVLGRVEELEIPSPKAKGGVREAVGRTDTSSRWPGGVIPYVIDASMPSQSRITSAVAHWNNALGGAITLVPHSGQAYYVRFAHATSSSTCSSYVGMIRMAGQPINIGNNCSTGNVIHEIGHAVGLFHEHTREDRDSFVRILWDNIISGDSSNFTQYATNSDDIGAYDYGSIMHYGAYAFSANGQKTIETIPPGISIGQRSGLSAGDISGARAMYSSSGGAAPPQPQPPQAVSSTPSSGNGASQTFAFQFSDPNGHADLHSVRILIHANLQGANSCYLYYSKADNRLFLHTDAANALVGPITPGSAGTLQNSQCSVNGVTSSATSSGNALTLNLAVSFPAGFAGTKNIYGFAQDLGGLIPGWATLGSWTVPGGGAPQQQPPQAVSSTPNSGNGASQTFAFQFSDPNGHADLHLVRILIHPNIQGANSCYLAYFKAENKLYLHNDAGTALIGPIAPGLAGTIENSQCSVNGAASSAASAGNNLTLNLAISFPAGFAGAKNVYGFAQDLGGLMSGWATLGSWTVSGGTAPPPQPQPPQAVSSTPNSGNGASQMFAFQFSDANGHADLHSVRILIHAGIQAASSCYLYYTKSDNKLYLHNNAASAVVGPVTPGSAGTIANSQCSVNGATSSAASAGNNLTLNLAISFPAGYAGTKNLFGFAQDLGGRNSGWATLGSWTVPGGTAPPPQPQPPQAVSSTPNSGNGASQMFAFQFSDANGHADLHSVRILIHAGIQAASSCYLYYTKSDNKLYLHNNAASAVVGPVTPGSAGTIENSQCSVNGATSSAAFAGNNLTLNLAISFPAGYAGTKNLFGFAQDLGGLNSGWASLGSWTVPGGGPAPQAPQAVSATPNSGAGSNQVLAFRFSDGNGHADIHSVRILIHPQIQGPSSCYLYYTKQGNQLYLHNDAANALVGPITVGSAGTIQNSQCSVNGALSSVTASGNDLMLSLSMSFPGGFTGQKNIFGLAQDLGGLISGWANLGSWNVP